MAVTLALLGAGAPAWAAPTTFHVVGTVSTAHFPDYHVLPGAEPGSAITGTVTYDPEGAAQQWAPSAFEFHVGTLRFSSGPQGLQVTHGVTEGPAGPKFALQSGGLGGTVSSDARLLDVFSLLQLQHGSGGLSISGLAVDPASTEPAEPFQLDGYVQLATVAPEPASAVLFLPAAAALGLFLRRRGPKRRAP